MADVVIFLAVFALVVLLLVAVLPAWFADRQGRAARGRTRRRGGFIAPSCNASYGENPATGRRARTFSSSPTRRGAPSGAPDPRALRHALSNSGARGDYTKRSAPPPGAHSTDAE